MKRLFDILLSACGLVMCAPLFIFVSFWIKFDSAGPVYFRQERVGRKGRVFRIHKFRSMVVNAEARGPQVTVGQDARITRSGRFLRKSKLDELPQLIDVLVGDMSLVGPRPEVPKYVVHYPADVRDRVLSVRPGITDTASIEFSNENEMLEGAADPEKEYIEKILPIKLGYYQKYVDQRSLWLDIRIIWQTIAKVWLRNNL
ncbi:MAG: sugar transferase [Sideroxydans sp.]|nr:sugar transferase [Sideroxydans sp.]